MSTNEKKDPITEEIDRAMGAEDLAPCPTCGAPQTTAEHRDRCAAAGGPKEERCFALDEDRLDEGTV